MFPALMIGHHFWISVSCRTAGGCGVYLTPIDSGFVVLPKCWIVERSIASLNRCRRIAKDWENLNRKALAFLRPASIRKLCNPA
jgi:transposase